MRSCQHTRKAAISLLFCSHNRMGSPSWLARAAVYYAPDFGKATKHDGFAVAILYDFILYFIVHKTTTVHKDATCPTLNAVCTLYCSAYIGLLKKYMFYVNCIETQNKPIVVVLWTMKYSLCIVKFMSKSWK